MTSKVRVLLPHHLFSPVDAVKLFLIPARAPPRKVRIDVPVSSSLCAAPEDRRARSDTTGVDLGLLMVVQPNSAITPVNSRAVLSGDRGSDFSDAMGALMPA